MTDQERTSRVAFSTEELDRLKDVKESEGLEELPHAAFIMRLVERYALVADSDSDSDDN